MRARSLRLSRRATLLETSTDSADASATSPRQRSTRPTLPDNPTHHGQRPIDHPTGKPRTVQRDGPTCHLYFTVIERMVFAADDCHEARFFTGRGPGAGRDKRKQPPSYPERCR